MLRNCRGKLLLRPSPFARHGTVLVRSWSLMSERLNSVVKVSPPVVSARDSKGQLSISMDRIGPSAYGVITLNQYDEASTARCARERVSVCHHARRSVPVAGQDQFQICRRLSRCGQAQLGSVLLGQLVPAHGVSAHRGQLVGIKIACSTQTRCSGSDHVEFQYPC